MMSLSSLVQGALSGAKLVIGPGQVPVSAGTLVDRYESCVSTSAESDVIVAMLTNDEASVGVILAAIVRGAQLVSLPTLHRGEDPLTYASLVESIRQVHGVPAVVARDDLAALLQVAGVPAIPHRALATAPLAAPCPAGFGLTQYSSGSTGPPRPVIMDDTKLGANLDAIIAVTSPQPGDVAVSWLPLSHDMGLVGLLLTGIAAADPRYARATTVVLLEPEAFLRRPQSWVDVMSEYSASFTAAPDFGYRLAVERGSLAPTNLSRLRVAIVGGEVVRARTLDGFATAFARSGFAATALCPAYGMAEIGLCATITPPHLHWREAARRLPDAAGSYRDVGVVSSGLAIGDNRVKVDSLTSAGIGSIRVSSPTLGADSSGQNFGSTAEGWYEPGDVGFIEDGWLYVCGRTDDVVVVRGRSVQVATLEDQLGAIPGLRAGRAVALGLATGGWIVVAETGEPVAIGSAEAGRLRQAARRACVATIGAAPDDVLLVERGCLPVTTSGKLRRRRAVELFAAHVLE